MAKKKSIIFIVPDYHCSFMYRDKLQQRGWNTKIYVNYSYPDNLLYSEKGINKIPNLTIIPFVGKVIQKIVETIYFIYICFKYKYHFYYANLEWFNIHRKWKFLDKQFGDGFRLNLWFAKKLGVKILFFPSGCNDYVTREEFSKFDNGNVCNNCGWGNVCNDNHNKYKLKAISKYVDFAVNDGAMETPHFNINFYKYKSLDLELWKPNLLIPKKFQLPKTKNLRILHSFYNENREKEGKNIKGSPKILEAINKLKEEGFKIEYMYINNIPSKDVKYLQSQADICIEQIIYGWWGSTGVETLSLGKPVIVYINKEWKKNYLEHFPYLEELPVVEANTKNIYRVLKKLVKNDALRKKISKNSRKFSKLQYDINNNAIEFENMILKI